jgi:hypothetical protein
MLHYCKKEQDLPYRMPVKKIKKPTLKFIELYLEEIENFTKSRQGVFV